MISGQTLGPDSPRMERPFVILGICYIGQVCRKAELSLNVLHTLYAVAHIMVYEKVSNTILSSIDDIVNNCKIVFGRKSVTRLQFSVFDDWRYGKY